MAEIRPRILPLLLLFSIFLINNSSGQLVCWLCDPCPDPHDNSSSLVSVAPCTTSQTVCVKNTVRVLNRQAQISKGCVSTCTPSSSNFFGQGAFVDCCNTNYCNSATRQALSMHFLAAMGAVLAFIFYQRQD